MRLGLAEKRSKKLENAFNTSVSRLVDSKVRLHPITPDATGHVRCNWPLADTQKCVNLMSQWHASHYCEHRVEWVTSNLQIWPIDTLLSFIFVSSLIAGTKCKSVTWNIHRYTSTWCLFMICSLTLEKIDNEIMENIIFEELRPKRCAQRNNAPLFLRQSLNADSEPWLCSHWAVVFLSEAPESGTAAAKKTSRCPAHLNPVALLYDVRRWNRFVLSWCEFVS